MTRKFNPPEKGGRILGHKIRSSCVLVPMPKPPNDRKVHTNESDDRGLEAVCLNPLLLQPSMVSQLARAMGRPTSGTRTRIWKLFCRYVNKDGDRECVTGYSPADYRPINRTPRGDQPFNYTDRLAAERAWSAAGVANRANKAAWLSKILARPKHQCQQLLDNEERRITRKGS